MKKRILLALTAVLVLGLAAAVYALNQTHNSHQRTADCCTKSDSCPMKNQRHHTQTTAEKASCCDMDDCCCKGDACPMKKNAEKETVSVDLKNVTVAADGENCCSGSCCCKDKHKPNV
jgi:hypothetical protein